MFYECMDRLLNMAVASSTDQSFYRLVHIHIPKTAGISFQSVIKARIPNHLHLPWDKSGEAWKELVESNRPLPRLVTGHIKFEEVFYEPKLIEKPILMISVLREPLERVISAYNYNRSDQHPHAEWFFNKFPNLKDYVHSFTKNSNLQCQWLCGKKPTEEKVRTIVNRFYCGIGILENIDSYNNLVQMAFASGKAKKIKKKNALQNVVYGKKASIEDISKKDIIEFKESNFLDYKVYNFFAEYYRKNKLI